MPIPMYGSPNLSKRYIGMGQYRPFPMYRLKSLKQNTSEFQVFIQSRCISNNFPRFYPLALAAYPRASRQKHTKYIGIQQLMAFPMYRQRLPKQNTSEFQVFIKSRCISLNFPRFYPLSLAAYSRAFQPHYDLRGDSLGVVVML